MKTYLNFAPYDVLEVSLRTDWVPLKNSNSPVAEEATEYRLLLAYGGPSVQVAGRLGKDGRPETARLEVCEWFGDFQALPLTESEESDLLARVLSFWDGEAE